MKKTITITVDEHGDSSIEANGHKGRKCVNETGELAALLGGVKDRKLKPEYFQQVSATAKVNSK